MRRVWSLGSAIAVLLVCVPSWAALVAGDVNQSEGVDAVDVQLVINGALGMGSVPDACDLDYSNRIDAVDVQIVINGALGIEIDADADGLCAGAETTWRTNPNLYDSDGDGVGDGQEVVDGTDPAFDESGFIPPNPALVAPELDSTAPTDLGTAVEFLYTGINPIQSGVADGTIEQKRVAVLRGGAYARSGAPLPGVLVTVMDHPEYGQTRTRGDGMFDLAVNGGTCLTLRYTKPDYLPAQRQVEVPWQGHGIAPDVVMISKDAQATTVEFTGAIQVAQGTAVSDGDGARQATVLFPPGTTAELLLKNGQKENVSSLTIRATEYSLGDTGEAAMPAILPPTSGYTYCVELTADEALKAGAKDIVFSQPVPFYVENFLELPVGGAVPTGYYDEEDGVWVPGYNGRIIEIVAVTGGTALIDVDGDGAADDTTALETLGITTAERERLAGLYSAGTSLWRVPLAHFSCWDHNWPIGPPMDATAPNQPRPTRQFESDEGTWTQLGSARVSSNGLVGAEVPVAGTAFSLRYRSDRAQGFLASTALEVPLTGAAYPESLKRIDLEIMVAGRQFTESFEPGYFKKYSFTWDRKDAYDRFVQGFAKAEVRLGYTYTGVIQSPVDFEQSFALFGGLPISGSVARQEISIWQPWFTALGSLIAQGIGLGGWNVNVHHVYDPLGRVLYLGSGELDSADSSSGQNELIITTIAGTGTGGFTGDGGAATSAKLDGPVGVAVGADGTVYIADTENHRVRRVNLDGSIQTFAGTGSSGFSGDGGPAADANLCAPQGLAVAPDGSLYIADTNNHRIRRVAPNGEITTVAGSGPSGNPWVGAFSGDGGPATAARLDCPKGIAIAPDGALYIADTENDRVRRVGTDGIITTVAGGGYSHDLDIPAREALLMSPQGLAVGPDGIVYIADGQRNRIFRLGTDGILRLEAGRTTGAYAGDGGPAADASLYFPSGIACGPDNVLCIGDLFNNRIRMVSPDDVIYTIAGSGTYGYSGDGGPATDAALRHPSGVAIGPDGSIYFADKDNHCVRRLSSELPGFSGGDLAIESGDGAYTYLFSPTGRHLYTLNATTHAVVYEFVYDTEGRLARIKNGAGTNLLTIQRDGAGAPSALVAQSGETTDLGANTNGYLSSIAKPTGQTASFVYSSDGLLTGVTDFDGSLRGFQYDEMGLLVSY